MEYILHVEGVAPGQTQPTTFYFATTGFTTAPIDTPANQFYLPRITRAGNFERSMFSSGSTRGAARSAFGNIELTNEDDGLSFLVDYAFDGRRVTLWSQDDGQTFAGRQLVFKGTMQQLEISEKRAIIRLRSRIEELNKDLKRDLFLGTTTGGGQNTAEGGPNDLKDRPKPLAWGVNKEIPLILANPYDRIYIGASNAQTSVEGIYENGLPYTRVGTYQTSIAGLMSVTLTEGQYAAMLNPFQIRVGATPTGVITADFTEGATPSDHTAAGITRRILERQGLVAGTDFPLDDVAQFASEAPAQQGVWIDIQEMSAASAIQEVLEGVQGYLTEDRLGFFRMGQFRGPDTQALRMFGEIEILDDAEAISRIPTNDEGNGIPVSKITYEYAPIGYVFDDGSIAGSVTQERKAYLKQEWRQVTEPNAAVAARHLYPTELKLQGRIYGEAAARAEVLRQLALYSVRRDVFEIKVDPKLALDIDLGDTVGIQLPRLGLGNGKLFAVVGIIERLSEVDGEISKTTLQLWG